MSPSRVLDPALVDYGRRLGLGEDKDLMSLADERMRRVASARVIAAMRVPSACQAVMSLHLAAEARGAKMELDEAVRLAGTRRAKYLKVLENVRTELGLAAGLSLEEAAAKLGCPAVRKEAAKILATYTKKNQVRGAEETCILLFIVFLY